MKRNSPSARASFHSCLLSLGIGLCLLGSAGLSSLAVAQDKAAPHPQRMKVGVALEGGGALGLAHIGVLRYFEQHHIPIDYLSGNSMGGLVGGLYATGQSPDQIEQLVEHMDWPVYLEGATPFQDLSFRRKEDARAVQSSLAIGFKKGAALPSGMNAGNQISLLLDRETLAYSDIKSFDDLPTPFRCVATNLVTGKAHVFSSGPIGAAMRSTMSLPGIFAPVADGPNLYVDGELVDNLPTDLVRDMGPDVVIAIHLQVAPTTAADLQTLFGTLGRSLQISSANSELRGMSLADIVVKVDVEKFTALDFTQAQALIQKGMEAAAAKAKILEPYVLNDADWAVYVAERDARKRGSVPVPQFVKVEGSSPRLNKQIDTSLQPLVNKPIDTKQLDKDLTLLTGMGRIASTSYSITRIGEQPGLLVNVTEKTNAPPVLQLGFSIDGSEPDNVTYTVGGRLTVLDIGGFGSEWRTDFAIGNTYGLSSEFYKRLTQTSKWFVAPQIHLSDSGEWIYSYNTPQADYRIGRAGGGVDFGYAIDRFSEVRAGFEIGYLNARLKLGTPEFASVQGEVSSERFRIITDHLDEPVVPRMGYLGQANFDWMNKSPGATSSFPVLEMRAQYFKPISHPASVFVIASGGTTFGYQQTGIPQFFLGGVPGLLAYGSNELRGNQYFLFRPGYMHRLFTLPPFVGGGFYAVGMYEVGKMYNDNVPGLRNLPMDGAIGVLANTAVGPLFFGGSVGADGHATWFYSLGHLF